MCFVDQEENHAAKVVKEHCFTMVASYEDLNDHELDQVCLLFDRIHNRTALVVRDGGGGIALAISLVIQCNGSGAKHGPWSVDQSAT